MKRSMAALVIMLIFNNALAGPRDGLKKGYIQNDAGVKCWYTQAVKENNTYFHGSLPGSNGVITVDDPACMSDSGVGLFVNKMMINNVISRWYSHSDAAFQTSESEMFDGSELQKKGKCIQSKKYLVVGITVDYFIQDDSITGAIHGSSIGGCVK